MFVLLLVLMFITKISVLCNAQNITVHQCDELPSCGDIHNISYPFRLKGQPQQCGEPKYELRCESNKTVLYLKNEKYFVQSIDRENLTIRLVDSHFQSDNCSSLPLPVHEDLFRELYPSYMGNKEVIFLSCEKQLSKSSLFIDTKPCINGSVLNKPEKRYSYVTYKDLTISNLDVSCSIDLVATISNNNYKKAFECGSDCSYLDFHDWIAYGFELSWKSIRSKTYCKDYGSCDLTDGGNTISGCYCDYDNGTIALGGSTPLDYLTAGMLILQDYIGMLIKHRFDNHYIFLNTVGILTAPVLAVRFVIGVPILFGLLIYKWRRRHLSYDAIENFLRSQNNLRPINYSFSDIKKMTKGFKDKLGQGGYGSVYKGRLRSGRDVAIKVLGKSKANGQEFINEVATIGRIHHVNVVRLVGFCAERSNHALLYEFMPNGSLEKHIYAKDQQESTLSYEQVYKISLGVARGIEYLHRGCNMRILHFDIKPHNILLDEDFNPKVSDFGLAKLYPVDGTMASLTAIRGTMGYMAPELFYKNLGTVSYKADVYSFGMLLLEMTGKRRNLNANAENSSQIFFPTWIYDQISKGKSLGIEDVAGDEIELVRKMIIIGLWCIQTRPSDRPSMNRVIEMLESDIKSLPMAPKPSLYAEDATIDVGENATSSVLPSDTTESSRLFSL